MDTMLSIAPGPSLSFYSYYFMFLIDSLRQGTSISEPQNERSG